jgi:hypothetical protein
VVYELSTYLSTELSTFGKDERIAAYRRNRITDKGGYKDGPKGIRALSGGSSKN